MTKNGENDPRMMVGFFIGFGWNCEKKKKKKLMVLELSAKTTFQEKLLWVKDQMFLSNQFTGLLDPKYLWKESIII